MIKKIAENAVLGTRGFFRWDGDQEGGTKAGVGYYLVWFQVVGDDGMVRNIMSRVIIATRF